MFDARKRCTPEVRDLLTSEGSSQYSALKRPGMYPTLHFRYIPATYGGEGLCDKDVVSTVQFEISASVKTADAAAEDQSPACAQPTCGTFKYYFDEDEPRRTGCVDPFDGDADFDSCCVPHAAHGHDACSRARTPRCWHPRLCRQPAPRALVRQRHTFRRRISGHASTRDGGRVVVVGNCGRHLQEAGLWMKAGRGR